MIPSEVALNVTAGSQASTELKLTNYSGRSLRSSTDETLVLRRADAVSKSVRTGFVAAGGDVANRLIALGRQLQSQPTLTVKLAISDPPEQLEPDASFVLNLTLTVPESPASEGEWRARLPLYEPSLTVILHGSTKAKTTLKRTRKSNTGDK